RALPAVKATEPKLAITPVTGEFHLQSIKNPRRLFHPGKLNKNKILWNFPLFRVSKNSTGTFTYRITIETECGPTFTVDPEMYVGVGTGGS
ncbi:MAG: hypothetical protein AAF725_27420, partial [Acidobacteriota bacterium]